MIEKKYVEAEGEGTLIQKFVFHFAWIYVTFHIVTIE